MRVLYYYVCASVIALMSMIGVSHAEEVLYTEGTVTAEDGCVIAYNHYERGGTRVIVLAHGFYNNKDTYLFKAMAESFQKTFDVISFDFRGHGVSEGLFTWTAEEDKDMRAIVRFAKEKGYEKVGVIGFSLGAAITIIEAADNPDMMSVIAVSAPSDFWKINYHFWKPEMIEDLKLNLGPKGVGKGIRPGNPFEEKMRPIDCVAQIAPRPVLFIHGEKDWLILPEHSQALYEKAHDPKAIEIIKDAGHAEKIYDAFPNEFIRICTEWFEKTL